VGALLVKAKQENVTQNTRCITFIRSTDIKNSLDSPFIHAGTAFARSIHSDSQVIMFSERFLEMATEGIFRRWPSRNVSQIMEIYGK